MAAGRTRVNADPAIEAWNFMRENLDRSFRLNARTLRIGAVLLIGIPFATTQLAFFGNNKLKQLDPWTKAKAQEESAE
ncbi:hypothetical protein BC828DRAFT_381818 [Blastocladiella britannica]|nr:hypothetical protein BC828DRAFT_381818 [Blastocladiella britannica]